MPGGANGSGSPSFAVFSNEPVKGFLPGLSTGQTRHDCLLDSFAEHLNFDPVPNVAAREVGFPEELAVLRPILERPLLEVDKFAGHTAGSQADSHFRCLSSDPGFVELLTDRRVLQFPISAVARLRSWVLSSFGGGLDERVMELLCGGHSTVLNTAIGHLRHDRDDIRGQGLGWWQSRNQERTTRFELATSSLGSWRSTN